MQIQNSGQHEANPRNRRFCGMENEFMTIYFFNRLNTNHQYIFGRNFYIKYVTIEINISTYFRNIKKCRCTKRIFLKSFYDHYCSLPIMLFEFNGSTDHIQCVNIFRFIMCSMVLPQAPEIKNNLHRHLK